MKDKLKPNRRFDILSDIFVLSVKIKSIPFNSKERDELIKQRATLQIELEALEK